MRATIELDDDLVREALAVTGARTMTEVIHLALEELVRS
jgi:Arc/MetJ family transcription regulator